MDTLLSGLIELFQLLLNSWSSDVIESLLASRLQVRRAKHDQIHLTIRQAVMKRRTATTIPKISSGRRLGLKVFNGGSKVGTTVGLVAVVVTKAVVYVLVMKVIGLSHTVVVVDVVDVEIDVIVEARAKPTVEVDILTWDKKGLQSQDTYEIMK